MNANAFPGRIPGFTEPEAGYTRGRNVWYVVLWAIVMWHWRHQTHIAPGEMNKAQVRQMDFIYTGGDAPGSDLWLKNNYLSMFLALVGINALK